MDKRGREHPPHQEMERRCVYRPADSRLRGGQDGGARQCEGRPRPALHEVPEVQLRERPTADLLAEPRPRADRRTVQREPDTARREQRREDQRSDQTRERAVAAGSDHAEE